MLEVIMKIKEEERIDDLDNEGLKIIQKKMDFVSEWIVFFYLILQKV